MPERTPIPCSRCGAIFTPRGPGAPQRYCSGPCRLQSRAARHKDRTAGPLAASKAARAPARHPGTPPKAARARGPVLTTEVDYTADETEFLAAMDRYRREKRRPFPTWSEALAVLRALGYRKAAEGGGG